MKKLWKAINIYESILGCRKVKSVMHIYWCSEKHGSIFIMFTHLTFHLNSDSLEG